MSSTTSSHVHPTRTGASTATLGVASGLVAAALVAAFAHDLGEIIISVSLIAVVTAAIFTLVVPRALRKPSAGGTALGLSIPAFVLALPAFWSGLPLVLGVAGLVVGNAGRRADSGAGKCIAAVVLSSLAILAYLAVYVGSGIVGDLGYLFD